MTDVNLSSVLGGGGEGAPVGAHVRIDAGAVAPAKYLSRASAQTLLQAAYPQLFSQIGIAPNQGPNATWSQNTAGVPNTTDALRSVGVGNGEYVAVGNSGVVWTATDPAGTWAKNTAGVPNTTDNLHYVAYDDVSGYWIACTNSAAIWYASDPTGTWTRQTGWSGITYSKWVRWGAYIVAASRNSFDATVAYTTDVTTAPTVVDINADARDATDIATDGTALVVTCLNGEVMVTTNLVGAWTRKVIAGAADDFNAVHYGNGLWIASDNADSYSATDPTGVWSSFTSSVIEHGPASVKYDDGSGYWLNAASSAILVTSDPVGGDFTSVGASVTNVTGVAVGPYHAVAVGTSGEVWVGPLTSFNINTQFYLPALEAPAAGFDWAIRAEA
jgi:hypothetical protein